MAHLGTIHSQLRGHAVILFSSGWCTLQRSPENWNAFRGKRPGQEKDLEANQRGPACVQPTEERLLILEGPSRGKRPIIVSCGLKEGELKSMDRLDRNFSLIKGKTFLAGLLLKDRIGCLGRQSHFMQKGRQPLSQDARKPLFWLNVWDQVSVSLRAIQGHTESEPPSVLIKGKKK